MADGYVAQFTARVALNKKDIADQLLSQFKDLQAQADKNQIVYKFTGDANELQGILKELQSKEIKLGTDVVIETSERDIQKQIDSLKSLLTKKARGIGDALRTEVANETQKNLLSLTDLIKLEGIGKSATSKNVSMLVESIQKELSNFDVTMLPFDKLVERLRFFESVRNNLGDINDIVGEKLRINEAEISKEITNIYKKAASYFGTDAGKDSIRQTIQNLSAQMQEMHEKIAPLAKTLSDLLSGKNINQSTTEQQVEKLNQELSEVNTELEKQLELRNQISKSSSPTHDYSAFTERALGGRAAQQVMTIQDMIAKNEDASAALDELYAINQEIIKRHAKVAGQARIDDLLKDYQPKTQNSQLEQIDKTIDKLIEKQKELQGQLATPVSNELVNLESVSATDEEIKQLTADIEDLQNDLTSVKEKAASDLNAAEQEMARIREELERTQKTLDTLSGSPDASDKLKDLAEQLKEAEKDFMEKAAELYEARNAQSALQEKYNEQAKTIQDYEKELASLRSELKKTQEQIDQFHAILGGKPEGYIEAKEVLNKVAAGEIASFDLYEQTWKQLMQSYTSTDASSTQQHFNKAATYYGTYVDQMKQSGKEYKRLIKDLDGATKDFTDQLLQRWEVLKNAPDSQPDIVKQHNALVQEKQNIEQSIQTTKKKINALKEEQQAEQEINVEIEKGNQKRKERAQIQKPVAQSKTTKEESKVTKEEPVQDIKINQNGNASSVSVYPEINAAVAREWKDKLTKMVAQLKIPVNVSPNSENTEKFQDSLNEQLKGVETFIDVKPKIDVSQWRDAINDSIVSLKANVPVAFDVNGEQQKALRSAANHLVAYNNTLFGKHPEGIISQRDIDLATKGREEILQLYPALEKYKKTLSVIQDKELVSSSQEYSIKKIQNTLESVIGLLDKHKKAIESEGIDISKIIDKEVESFQPLLAVLNDVERAVIAKTKQFQIEGDIVPGVIKIEWNQLNQLLILLNKIKVNIGSISKTKININYVDTIKKQKAKADKENKSQVYAAYKEMLGAYKQMAAAKAILDTADNPLNRGVAKNEYLAAEEIFKKNQAIIEQNQEIISQEKVIQDLSTIDDRLQSKVSYSNAGKVQKSMLLYYKQMLDAYKQMAKQQIILETNTDKPILNNAQLAYKAAEKTYLQKKAIIDANKDLIDQEKLIADLNEIEVSTQQRINELRIKQKQNQQAKADKENRSQVYATYKEMLDAYKQMAAAKAILDTTDNPLDADIVENEYRAAEEIYKQKQEIIKQNQNIISQEKLIQDLSIIDDRFRSKASRSNAEKQKRDVLLHYKQMLSAYKQMAQQQVILETSTDEAVLNNAQLAYNAAEETYLQKKNIVDANSRLIDQEKLIADLNEIEVSTQQRINELRTKQKQSQQDKLDRENKSQVYATYKAMLDAYKRMAAAQVILDTVDNPLSRDIAKNEYLAAEEIFKKNRAIIEQNQKIISQEKIIQDLRTVDDRFKSQVGYSNAEKMQRSMLLHYKQMLDAYKQMAKQQVILETNTDKNMLDNARLAYNAAEETYLQKRAVIDANKDLIDQEKLITDLNEIEISAQQRINELMAKQKQSQQDKLDRKKEKERIRADKNAAKEEEDNIKKLSNLQEKYQKKYADFITNRGTEPFSENYQQLLSEYQEQLQALLNFDFSSGTIKQLQEIEQKLKDITNNINRTKGNAAFTLVNKEDIAAQIAALEKFMRKNDAMSSSLRVRYKDIVKSLQDALNNGINEIDYSKIIQQIKELDIEFHRAGKSGRTMWERIKASARGQTAHFVGMYLSIQDWIRYLRQGINTVIELDTALTELRKVSDASTNRLQQSLKESTKTAQELGASISDVINMTADWARLGYSIDEAERLANITTLFKNVGDNMNADDASSYLISTMRGFQIAADDAEMIVDKYNEVANNFAIDTAGIGEALQRSAASFNAANTSLSESIALITATNSVVQNPESVGTLWKTLSARIRGAKTELEDLGEEADKYTETTSKLRDLVMSLTGFDIMADENTFKSVYDIIIGIGKEWDKLTDIEQASLGEALAGKRNANALYAVLGNIDQLEEAYMAAENAAGSAEKEQENYAKSIQYSIDQIKASLAALTSDILDSQSIKNIVDFGTDALQFIDELITRNKRLETLRNILLIIIRLIVVKFAQDGAKKLQKAFDALVSATRNFYAGLKTAARGIKSFNSDIDQLTEEEKAATAAVKSLSNALITIGIAIASYIITEAVNYMNNVADAAQNATDNLNENAEQLSNYISSIQSLRNKLDDSNTTTSEAIEYNAQLRDIQKELIKLYGDAAGEIDIFNGSLEEQGGIISQLNELASSDVAQQRWLNEVNNRSFGQQALRMALTPYIGESTAILLDHFFGTNFSVVLKNNFDAINQKYESFSKKVKATSDDTLNYIINSYDNIELKDGVFEISGNVEDVQTTIIDIQTRLKSYAGYTEDFNAQLTEVYNKAADIQSKFGETYNQGLAFAVGNDATARTFQTQLEDAVKAYDIAVTDAEKEVAKQSMLSILTEINDSDLDEALKRYLIKQSGLGDSYAEIISKETLNNWQRGLDVLKQYNEANEKIEASNSQRFAGQPVFDARDNAQSVLEDIFGVDWNAYVNSEAFKFFEKLSNGVYTSSDILAMDTGFMELADTLRLDNEQLLELLRLLGLLDNKEAIISQLTSGHRTNAKDYIAEQIANTDDGMEIYNALLSSGGATYLESAEGMTYVKQFFDNYRNTIIAESDKTKKTIDSWFEKNGDLVDNYQKNLSSINEAISGYYNGTLSSNDMIDLYQEFPEIIESSDDLGTALKKLRVKQIKKLYDDLGEDVPDKLRLELQRLEDQADQTAEALNNFSFENTVQSLKDGVEMIQSLNAGFEDGERGFDTIFSDDFVKTFGKYKKEYSALVKTVETNGFKTNKKLQEQARQQANALGNAWIKDNLGLLNEEQLNAAKAIFEEMSVQIEGVAMAIQTIEEAQQAAADAGLDWNNITANSIQQLLTEGVITAQTAREIIYYKMQELAAGNASIDTSTSIENLLMLQATLQSVGVSLSGFQGMIARINSLKTMRANGLTRDKITGEDYYDQWVKEAIDGWVNKPVEITIPDASDFGSGKDNNGGGGGGSDEKDAAEEVVDWIEKLIDRLERKLSHLEKVAGSAYETWETRAGALSEAIGATTAEIEAQRAAYDRYMQEAANVGLDESYAQKVRDGALDIETITDEDLKDKISKYEEYYTAALDAEEKIYDLTLHLSELAQQQFELIQTKFEKMITSLEADITHLQNEIDDIFQKTLSTSYDELIAMRRQEIDLLQQEYNELTQSLADSVAAGYITEGTEAWYDMDTAIKEVSNSLQEQRNTIHELIKEQFDLIDTMYSNIINNLSLRYDKMEAAINHLETVGFVESEGIYRRQMTEELNNLSKYYDELQEQQNAFNNAVAQGMEEGSDAWFEMQDAINSTWNSIIECISSIDDLQVKLWELDWSKFDHAQNMIQNVVDEANFLIGMFDEISLIDDYGFFTSNGVATEGLHMQNYQTMKQQAQMYLDAIHDIEDIMNGNYDLNSETFTYLTEEWSRLTGLEADPEMWAEELRTNDKLLQRKQELIDAYQGAIQGAEDEKDAIIDLINQAYDAQLAYINKLIDAKKEQLDADKALYEYSKNVEEQTKNIGTLQNQLAAIANDNSEEAMARRQKLQAELDEAQKQLDETQYDKWYNDQQEMLDKLSEEYGEMIDEVKKNEDKNFAQIQEYLDANLEEVHGALDEVADKVGYEIQENAFSTIWGSSSTMSDVLGGVQSSIDTIIAFNERMYAVATNLSDWFTRWLGMDSTITDETSARNFVNGLYQTFLDRDADEAGFQDWYEQLRNGATVEDIIKGFVFSDEYMAKNKSDREIIEDLYQAILGRNGEDAGIANWLDYLKKGATWEDVIRGFVESTEFSESGQWERLLDDWLDVDSGYGNSILSGLDDTSRLNNEWFQHWLDNLNKTGRVSVIIEPTQGAMGNISIDTLNFDLPNVTDYQSFVKAAQSDPNFEKMVQSMTVNKIAGGSSLAKYKY